jgi:hypothetical protein
MVTGKFQVLLIKKSFTGHIENFVLIKVDKNEKKPNDGNYSINGLRTKERIDDPNRS